MRNRPGLENLIEKLISLLIFVRLAIFTWRDFAARGQTNKSKPLSSFSWLYLLPRGQSNLAGAAVMDENNHDFAQTRVALKFCRVRPIEDGDMALPAYHSEMAAGMDVAAAVPEPVVMEPGEIRLFPSGFSVAIPAGYEIQVRPRSGLAVKHGITVVNAPGTVDADYRGEIMIALINLGSRSFTVERYDRIAQLVLAPVCGAVVSEVATLDRTIRQDGGFGHTGK